MIVEIKAVMIIDDSCDEYENETLEKEMEYLQNHMNHPQGDTRLISFKYEVVEQ